MFRSTIDSSHHFYILQCTFTALLLAKMAIELGPGLLSNRNRDLSSPVIPLIRLWGADAGEDVRPGRFPPGP